MAGPSSIPPLSFSPRDIVVRSDAHPVGSPLQGLSFSTSICASHRWNVVFHPQGRTRVSGSRHSCRHLRAYAWFGRRIKPSSLRFFAPHFGLSIYAIRLVRWEFGNDDRRYTVGKTLVLALDPSSQPSPSIVVVVAVASLSTPLPLSPLSIQPAVYSYREHHRLSLTPPLPICD